MRKCSNSMLKTWRKSLLWGFFWDCEFNTDWYLNISKIKPKISILYSIKNRGSFLAPLELLGMAPSTDPCVPSSLAAPWKLSLLAHVPLHLCTQKSLPVLSLPLTDKTKGQKQPRGQNNWPSGPNKANRPLPRHLQLL